MIESNAMTNDRSTTEGRMEGSMCGSTAILAERSQVGILSLGSATLRQKLEASALRDHHGRVLPFALGSNTRSGEHCYFAVDPTGRCVGWMSSHEETLLLIRGSDLAEGFVRGGMLGFPVTERFEEETWIRLLLESMADLEARGCERALTLLPLEAAPAATLLGRLGFEPGGICTHAPTLAEHGWSVDCRVYACELHPIKQRPTVLPRLLGGRVRSDANSSDAPEPSLAFWDEVALYSSFSLYPHTTEFARQILTPADRSLLTLPCAAGDLLRLVPPPLAPFRCGIDLSGRALALARLRLLHPRLDELNGLLLQGFAERATGRIGETDLAERLGEIVDALAPHPISKSALQLDLSAAFVRLIQSPAIPDWAVLSKILALTLFPQAADAVGALEALAERLPGLPSGAPLFPPPPAPDEVSLLSADLRRPLELNTTFDVVVVWEACLMFHAWGTEEPFLANLYRHVGPAGRLVLTGIRGELGQVPAELRNASRRLRSWGMDCTLSSLVVPPPTWLPGATSLVLPMLTAWKTADSQPSLPNPTADRRGSAT